MASLVDTNVLVYCFDPRDPARQGAASEVLREGQVDDSLVLALQSIVEFIAAEFIAAVIRPRAGSSSTD